MTTTSKTAYAKKATPAKRHMPVGGLTLDFDALDRAGFQVEQGPNWVNITGTSCPPDEAHGALIEAANHFGLDPADTERLIEHAHKLHLWAALRKHC
jgi:hypothetical protein